MRSAFMLAALLAVPALCFGQTIWYVPDDFSTIQGAISDVSVVNGDTVIVRPGTYVENIDFIGKAITVSSTNPNDPSIVNNTILDGYKLGSVVSFTTSEGPDSILEGFKIINGSGSNSGPALFGGGIYCYYSSPTITNNTISQNSAFLGGGIYCINISPMTIRDNTVSGNRADINGGGIYYQSSSMTLTNNKIFGNHASDGGGINCTSNFPAVTNNITNNTIFGNRADSDGGGIACYSNYSTIMNNTISGNRAASNGGGIKISSDYSMIANNMISGNSAGYGGGGIFCHLSSLTIRNNTVSENSAAGSGGGIACYQSSTLEINNSILWDNTAISGPEIVLGSTYQPSSLTIGYSDVKGGQSSVLVAPLCTLIWDSSMIDADPIFVDPAIGDYHLTYSSPCKDTGDNTVVTELYDFEGDQRVAYSTVDMGADEFNPHLYYKGDATPTGNIEIKFIGIPGNFINGIILGVNIFDPPLPCDYGLWYMNNPMQIITGLGTIPANGVSVIPGTIPASPAGPYTIYLQAAIDSWLTNLCSVNVQ